MTLVHNSKVGWTSVLLLSSSYHYRCQ